MTALTRLFIALLIPPVVFAGTLLEEAKKDYHLQVDKYRETYEDFEVKSAQYQQLQTFAAEEALVTSAKDMLMSRIEVWWAYWQTLKVEVSETNNFTEGKKEELAVSLEKEQGFLQEHRLALQNMTTLPELRLSAPVINNKADAYSLLALQTVSQTRIARLKTAVIELQAFTLTLEEAVNIQIRQETERDFRLRGITEVKNTLNTAQVNLLNLEADPKFSRQKPTTNIYSDLTKSISPIYQEVERSFKLLKELSQGIEL